jgi:GTP cyclohydrolase I
MGKNSKDFENLEKLVSQFLAINSLDNANFFDTPRRVASLWHTFLNQEKPPLRAFPTTSQEMILLKNHIVWGFCPHHLLPVRYTFKIGYIPQDKTLGLSKIARLANWCLSKLPLQEDIPNIILNELHAALKPLGSGCQVKGYHLCVAMRGVHSAEAEFVTTGLRGVMLYNASAQHEFLTS